MARRADSFARTVPPEDRDALVVAAWLHDIGYSPDVYETGFHPLDGARYLHRHGWPLRICALVAHHSGAEYVAAAHGVSLAEFPREDSAVSDALCYADQTTGPTGQPMTLDERLAEAHRRHGADSVQARARHGREPYLRAVQDRVKARLAARHDAASAGGQRPAHS